MHQQRTRKQYMYMYVQSAESRIVDPDLNQIRMRRIQWVSGFGYHKNEKKKKFNV